MPHSYNESTMNRQTIIAVLLALVASVAHAKTYKRRRVRDDLKINGFHNFDDEWGRLLEKMK